MKTSGKYFLATTIALLIPGMVHSSMHDSEYSINYYQDCKLVKTAPLNTEQIQAYKQLNLESEKMQQLQAGIEQVQPRMESLSHKIQKLAKLAIRENEDQIWIDKSVLQQQELVASELELFMQKHKSAFSALEYQGTKVDQAADRFRTRLNSLLSETDYDQVQVTGPDTQQQWQCAELDKQA